MTDLFPFDSSQSQVSDSNWTADISPESGDSAEVVRAPLGLLFVAYAACVVALVCFVAGSRTFNYIGYVLAGVISALAVVVFRSIDRRRRRSSRYVFLQYHRLITSAPLFLGIVIAAGHAYFVAQQRSLAN